MPTCCKHLPMKFCYVLQIYHRIILINESYREVSRHHFNNFWPDVGQVACCSIPASCNYNICFRSVWTANNVAFAGLDVWMWHFQVMLMLWDSRYSAKCSARHAPPVSASLSFFLHNRLCGLIVYQLIVSLYPLNDYSYMHNNTQNAAVGVGSHNKNSIVLVFILVALMLS